jgi:hypothetical protein
MGEFLSLLWQSPPFPFDPAREQIFEGRQNADPVPRVSCLDTAQRFFLFALREAPSSRGSLRRARGSWCPESGSRGLEGDRGLTRGRPLMKVLNSRLKRIPGGVAGKLTIQAEERKRR